LLEEDIKVVLAITNDSHLMADLPWIAESIQLRNVYTDPLNVLQAELLYRSRLTEEQGKLKEKRGEEEGKSGKPIFYTSADSVFQIACHEETFGLDKRYELCEITRDELTEGGYNIGRVIARPFLGDKAGNFQRTGNRHDLAVEPPAPTVLKKLV
ncbi:phosphoenolpyruvate carboxylase, partial [Salmonella enterica]|uniref:phosphoenolpyruvate carboxylase n=1 Tax=Salmonella enterica TaxID=28901 RepID=UPI001F1FE362